MKSKIDAGEDFLFLDVREQDELEAASIDGATFLPMSEIQQRVAELEPHKERDIVVFCHGGVRSLQVTAWLQQQGYASVKSLRGGIDAWSQVVDSSVPRY